MLYAKVSLYSFVVFIKCRSVVHGRDRWLLNSLSHLRQCARSQFGEMFVSLFNFHAYCKNIIYALLAIQKEICIKTQKRDDFRNLSGGRVRTYSPLILRRIPSPLRHLVLVLLGCHFNIKQRAKIFYSRIV